MLSSISFAVFLKIGWVQLGDKSFSGKRKNNRSCNLSQPFTNDLLDLTSNELGLNVFGLILSKVVEIDYLNLNYNGHTRCKFIIDKNKIIKSNWVTP